MNANVSPLTAVEPRPRDDGFVIDVHPFSWKRVLLLAVGSVVAFHLAYGFPPLSFLIVVFLYGLFRLTALPSPRKAFYFGLVIGYAVYAPHLTFFWTIFGWPAVALWTVLAFWLGLFVALARVCRRRFGRLAVVLVPFVWTGLEYFRGELYFLRFSWLNVGHVFSSAPQILAVAHLGMYGVALILMTLVASLSLLPKTTSGILFGVCLIALGCFVNVPTRPPAGGNSAAVQVAGLQMEFPAESELLAALEEFAQKHPQVELVVLSEYSLQRPPSEEFKGWCRRYQRYLIVGGKDFVSDEKFYNTVFVVAPNGEVVFRQAKGVPVQFFADGLPAREQRLWTGLSRVGDLKVISRTSVMQYKTGAQRNLREIAQQLSVAHLVEGSVQRVANRVRVNSQLIDARGRVLATAPFPGQGAIIEGRLELGRPGHLPLDHWLAPLSVFVTAAIILWVSAKTLLGKISRL